MQSPAERLIVGVAMDSAPNLVDAAVQEAERRDARVHVVHATPPPVAVVPQMDLGARMYDDWQAGQALVSETRAEVARRLDVNVAKVSGGTLSTGVGRGLVANSRLAGLMVLGRLKAGEPGGGGRRVAPGSVLAEVAARSTYDLLVVPEEADVRDEAVADGGVVVVEAGPVEGGAEPLMMRRAMRVADARGAAMSRLPLLLPVPAGGGVARHDAAAAVDQTALPKVAEAGMVVVLRPQRVPVLPPTVRAVIAAATCPVLVLSGDEAPRHP